MPLHREYFSVHLSKNMKTRIVGPIVLGALLALLVLTLWEPATEAYTAKDCAAKGKFYHEARGKCMKAADDAGNRFCRGMIRDGRCIITRDGGKEVDAKADRKKDMERAKKCSSRSVWDIYKKACVLREGKGGAKRCVGDAISDGFCYIDDKNYSSGAYSSGTIRRDKDTKDKQRTKDKKGKKDKKDRKDEKDTEREKEKDKKDKKLEESGDNGGKKDKKRADYGGGGKSQKCTASHYSPDCASCHWDKKAGGAPLRSGIGSTVAVRQDWWDQGGWNGRKVTIAGKQYTVDNSCPECASLGRTFDIMLGSEKAAWDAGLKTNVECSW